MKDEKLAMGLLGAVVAASMVVIFQSRRKAAKYERETAEAIRRSASLRAEAEELLREFKETDVKAVLSVAQDATGLSVEDLRDLSESPELFDAVSTRPGPKVVVLPPWRFRRLAGIPAPHVVDARRLANLPAADIRHALHRAYAGNLQPAKRLHAQLRLQAERAVSPLRESAVGALEDMYVLHPNADFGDNVTDA